MTIAVVSLGDGQLAATIGDIYTSPASTQTIVETITLVNTHTSAITANLYLLPSGGTARRICSKDMSLAAGRMWVGPSIVTLSAGDKIQGDASVAAKVDYVLNGVTNS